MTELNLQEVEMIAGGLVENMDDIYGEFRRPRPAPWIILY